MMLGLSKLQTRAISSVEAAKPLSALSKTSLNIAFFLVF
jgi:hypothetical protein